MYARVDLICDDNHIVHDVVLKFSKHSEMTLPPCSFRVSKDEICGKPTEQSYNDRKPSEGYGVVNGANW